MAAPAPPKAGAQKQQQKPRSFLVGTQDVIEGGDYDQTVVATNSGSLTPWTLQATGWLRALALLCQGTGLTAGTVTADAPFNIFANVELDDVNNEAIFGPFDGYTAFLTNKYGGDAFWDDPATQSIFTVSGTVSANNFTFVRPRAPCRFACGVLSSSTGNPRRRTSRAVRFRQNRRGRVRLSTGLRDRWRLPVPERSTVSLSPASVTRSGRTLSCSAMLAGLGLTAKRTGPTRLSA